jgi:2-(1,2-epoxy-1,2-dihydrophenyl)acetyl-CoA isomerase
MGEFVLFEQDGAVATVTLNRPNRHNSLIPPMLHELHAILTQIDASRTIRVVVLNAAGRSFSTGGDVAGFYERLDDIADYAIEIVGALNAVILKMCSLAQPIVAAVHGIVTGGSMGLVLAADIVLVAPQASFTPYYSVVGFSPDGGWTALLPDVIGRHRVANILMTNGTISAEKAVEWGLASRMVSSESIQTEARTVAAKIATMKQGSIARIKRQLNHDDTLAERLERERQNFVAQIQTEEAQAGIRTFLKRSR